MDVFPSSFVKTFKIDSLITISLKNFMEIPHNQNYNKLSKVATSSDSVYPSILISTIL
jgi:hypothetical protein